MFESRTTDDLIKIAATGGGFRLGAATRRTDELIRIAAAAANKGSRVYLSGMAARTVDDLIRIGAAGNGSVVFED